MTTLKLHTVDTAAVEHARTTGRDTSGNPVMTATAEGGEPLRCCLRDATAGEQVILFGYRPALPPSPYVETGAVFAHAERCAGPRSTTDYPTDWRGRPQVVRAYDERGWIHPASTVHDGSDPEAVLVEVLAQPGVVEAHSRNVAYGCFMFAATLSPTPSGGGDQPDLRASR